MTTYEEVITWHSYPEDKPRDDKDYLAKSVDGDVRKTRYGRITKLGKASAEWTWFWSRYNGGRHCYEHVEVVEWAEMPKGMRRNEKANNSVLISAQQVIVPKAGLILK